MITNARDEKWSEWIPVYRESDMPTDRNVIGQWKSDDGYVSGIAPLWDVEYGGPGNVIAYRYKIKEPKSDMHPDNDTDKLDPMTNYWSEAVQSLGIRKVLRAINHGVQEAGEVRVNFEKDDKYSAYFKDVRHIDTLDVYRVVSLFDCEKHGHPISHAAKKLLLSGSRTGGKDVEEDVREAIDTLCRWLEMREEDARA